MIHGWRSLVWLIAGGWSGRTKYTGKRRRFGVRVQFLTRIFKVISLRVSGIVMQLPKYIEAYPCTHPCVQHKARLANPVNGTMLFCRNHLEVWYIAGAPPVAEDGRTEDRRTLQGSQGARSCRVRRCTCRHQSRCEQVSLLMIQPQKKTSVENKVAKITTYRTSHVLLQGFQRAWINFTKRNVA